MNTEETTKVSYADIKEPHKQITEKHASPRKSSVLNFNPDGSLCIPSDLKQKLSKVSHRCNVPKSKSQFEDDPDGISEVEGEDEGSTPGSSKENLTPESSRKRRKRAAPRLSGKISKAKNKREKKPMPVVLPDDGCCHFCYTKDSSRALGELREVDGIIGHHNCLLFSSGLCQAGKNEEGLWGFLIPDIKKELSRGKRLRCTYCKLPGALVGCHEARCPCTYHYTCGIEAGCLMQYYDNFRSFCTTHRPLQFFLPEMIGTSVECPTCGDEIVIREKTVPREVLVTECCNMTPLHRQCIQNQADASGYFFRCPMCNNEKKFNSVMKIMGVNIPQSDAVWEKDGYYDDLLEEYWNCDVPICLHADGRKGDSRNKDKWDLMKCGTCGQSGAHPACLGYEKRGPKDWSCAGCVLVEAKLEEERKKEAASAHPPSPSLPPPPTVPAEAPGSSNPAVDAGSRKKKPLNPAVDPYLMTPEMLKEAVYKLCVAKLKQQKQIRKNVNPDKWIGLPTLEEEEDEDILEVNTLVNLVARPFNIVLIRRKYSPTPITISDSDDEVVDVHKERMFEFFLKTRKRKKLTDPEKVVRQTSISSFFKRKHKETEDEDLVPPKRRKILNQMRNPHEPFPFNRSPHSITEAESIPLNLERTPTKPLESSGALLCSPKVRQLEQTPTKSALLSPKSAQTPLKAASSSPKPMLPSPKPMHLSPKPMHLSPKPLHVSPKPVQPSPKQMHLSPKPMHLSPKPMHVSPKPVQPSPKPMQPSPKPVQPSPKPVHLSPKPVQPSPKPVQPSPKPMHLSPKPALKSPVSRSPSTSVYQCYFCTEKFSRVLARMEHMCASHPAYLKGWSGEKGKSKAGPHKIKNDVTSPDDVSSSPPPPPLEPPRRKPAKSPKSGVRSKKKRGRPRKKKLSVYEEEMNKYADLCIEHVPCKKDAAASSSSSVSPPSIKNFFSVVPPKKRGYDWSDNEVTSLIEFYSLNAVLWDASKNSTTETDDLLRRLHRKLSIPVEAITSKWKELTLRYKEEKHEPDSTWQYLSQLDFLEQNSLTSCPEDVSPLFSLLSNNTDMDTSTSPPESPKQDCPLETSQDIFVLSDDDEEEEEEKKIDSYKDNDHPKDKAPIIEVGRKSDKKEAEIVEDLVAEDDHLPAKIIEDFAVLDSSDLVIRPYDETEEEKEIDEQDISIVEKGKNNFVPCIVYPTLSDRKKCRECSKVFVSGSAHTQHKTRPRFLCYHCIKTFASQRELLDHQSTFGVLHRCPFCDKEFTHTDLEHRNAHVREIHVEKWLAHECTLCEASFRSKHRLLHHLEGVHEKYKPDALSFIRFRDYRCLYDA